jgi:hypothetical protein
VLDSLAAFFERESCGQCPPCTVGTASLRRIAGAVAAGGDRTKELSAFAEAAGFMKDHGFCAHCRTAASCVGALLQRNGGAAANGAASACRPFDPDSPERLAIERVAAAFGSSSGGGR